MQDFCVEFSKTLSKDIKDIINGDPIMYMSRYMERHEMSHFLKLSNRFSAISTLKIKSYIRHYFKCIQTFYDYYILNSYLSVIHSNKVVNVAESEMRGRQWLVIDSGSMEQVNLGQGQKEIWERQLFLENSDHLLPTHKLLMINMYYLFSSRMR